MRAGIPARTFDRDRAGRENPEGGEAHPPSGAHEADHPSAGGHADHMHAGEDPHVWLNPRFARTLAANVAESLTRIDPAHAPEYRARLAVLEAELDSLDAEVAVTLAPVRGRDLVVYHPFYGYLADAYGLRQVTIEVGGFKPGSKYLTQVVERARTDGGKAVFVQEGASTASAETVAREIGARVVTLDPMSRNYLDNLRLMAVRIRDGILGK
jgi:zinc transport system substrate-binding protein